MNWLEKLSGRKGQTDASAERPGQPSKPRAGGTVVRSGANASPNIAISGYRFEPGVEIAGNLQIKALLGSGGMGEVYLARQMQWDADIAVKIPNAEILTDADNRHRIVSEAEAWTKLGLHPHVAYCYYAQQVDDLLLLVIEYVDGGNLRTWISDGRCADLKTGLDLAIQFCHGLEHAHKQALVHRDIKPENILLTRDGMLKITDFGITHEVRTGVESSGNGTSVAESLTLGMTKAGVGTAGYMPPEQWDEQKEIDLRADIFAFGVCLYEMLCGQLPYPEMATLGPRLEPPDPGVLRRGSGLPESLRLLMIRCVDWDKDKRPSSASEILAELCHVYQGAFGEPSTHAVLPEISTLADDWNNRALSYLVLSREEDAERAWQTAMEADAGHVVSIYNYGLHSWRGAKATDDEIVRVMRGVAESDSSAWLPRYLLSQLHVERGDPAAAFEELGKINGDELTRIEVIAAKQALEELQPTRPAQTFKGHDGIVNCACLSRNGLYALSGSGDRTLKLWDVESGHCVRTFEGHKNAVQSVCLSGDGRYALSGSDDLTLKLWDVESGHCIRTFEGHKDSVNSVCLSRDGRYALSGSKDKTLKLWKVGAGYCLRTFEGHTGSVTCVCLSVDGRHALSGSYDRNLRLWDVESGGCLRTFEGHFNIVSSVCLSADGRYALSGSFDRTLKRWELESGRCVHTFKGHTDLVNSISLSDDGQYVLSGSYDNALRLWDAGSGRCLRTFDKNTEHLQCAWLSADGRSVLWGHSWHLTLQFSTDRSSNRRAEFRLGQLVRSAEAIDLSAQSESVLTNSRRALMSGNCADACKTLRLARSDSRLRRAEPFVREWAQLYRWLRARALSDCWKLWCSKDEFSFCLSEDGRLALSGRSDGKLEIRDVLSGRCLRTFEGHSSEVQSVCLSTDARFALSGSSDKTMKLWEVDTGHCLRSFEGHTEAVLSVCLSADGRYALSGAKDATLKLWDLESGSCLRTFEGHCDYVYSVKLIGNGRYALSKSADNMQGLWEVDSGRCLQTYEERYNWVDFAFLSADSPYALTCGESKTLKLLEIASGRCLRTFEGHTGNVESICLTGDGRQALSASADKTLRLWEVETGRCLRTFKGHSDWVQSVCLSGDGRFAVSGSSDKTVKLWEVATGHCLRTLEGHTSVVRSVCLSGDGRYALSGSDDRTAKIWDLASGLCLRTLEHASEVFSVSLCANQQCAVSSCGDGDVTVWFLDWDLEENGTTDWDEGARPYLDVFLRAHQPFASTLPQGSSPTAEEVTCALTRQSRPEWSEEDFQSFLCTLRSAGYGWLRPGGIRHELERMTAFYQRSPDWDEGARSILKDFLRTHRSNVSAMPQKSQSTNERIMGALTSPSRPKWSEDEFQGLLHTLGCAGYGWLRPEGVRDELERVMTLREVMGLVLLVAARRHQ